MLLAETVTFGGSGLERAGHLRGDPAVQRRLLADPAAGVLPLWQGKPLVLGEEALSGGWLPAGHPALRPASEAPVFLGLDGDAPRFAADVSSWEPAVRPDTLGAFTDPSEQAAIYRTQIGREWVEGADLDMARAVTRPAADGGYDLCCPGEY